MNSKFGTVAIIAMLVVQLVLLSLIGFSVIAKNYNTFAVYVGIEFIIAAIILQVYLYSK